MSKELIITLINYDMGGAQRRAFSLANNFVKKGYNVYVLSVLGENSSLSFQNHFSIDERVNVVFIPEYYKKHKKNKIVAKSEKIIKHKISFLKKLQLIFKPFKRFTETINYNINGFKKCCALRSFMISHHDSIVINFGFNIYDRIHFAVKGLNCKIIYAETNASNKYSLGRFFNFTSKSIKKSNATVFQTVVEKEEHGLTKNPKAYVIHNPIKTDLPKPYEGNRNKTIVNFCRLSRQKNLLLLIQAFERFHSEFPDYKLEIYADSTDPNDFEYKNELMSFVFNNNLTDYVFLLPPTSDIHNIILNYAMFVSSSDYEGISNSMIEAMAIGLPCVCTDCGGGGAREMITDGENGLLVPIGDVEALKNAMIRMITEEGLSKRCSKNAAKIRETHSIENIAEKWIEIINKI